MTSVTEKFFELVQISLGEKNEFEDVLSKNEWNLLFQMACKHSLAGILLEGVNKVKSSQNGIDQKLLLEWIGIQQVAVSMNHVQNERAISLCNLFKEGGFKSCILKGQGTALYYEYPEFRQCGDIDIWVKGDRDVVLDFIRKGKIHIGHIDIKHSDIDFFEDVHVEVHFLPSWMYSPITNDRLQRFFDEQSETQFGNVDLRHGFAHTTIEFDLVYSMVHIYRHIFSEGIGLRQLMDYYFILQHSSFKQRQDAMVVLASLKMRPFVGGIMRILRECFGMEEEYLLCAVNERHGKFLLSEILISGNFGQFDDRILRIDEEKRFERGFVQLKRNLRFVGYYPSEVLWSPFWKLWHWYWRKMKGYL